MLLLPSPRFGRQRRASLRLTAAVLALVIGQVCASLPAASRCPTRVGCVRQRRHACKPGSAHCGPCLSQLEEDTEGHCVPRKTHHHSVPKVTYLDLDEEIDYLHSVIEKQKPDIKPIPKPQAFSLPRTASLAVASSQPDDKTKIAAPDQNTTTASPPPPPPPLSPRAFTPASTVTPLPRTTGEQDRVGRIAVPLPSKDAIIVILISLCILVGTVAMILAAICYVRLHQDKKVDYPAFGGQGKPPDTANGTSLGDKTLAQNAQMYHYQHQKQQMLSMESHKPEQKVTDCELTSDEDDVGGDFTVYECPGLAPTGEMEVKNPLFDDSTLQYQGDHK